jgi:hypothetical protein
MAGFTKILGATAVALCLAAVSANANAMTFANFGQSNTTGKQGVVWRQLSPATNGALFSDSQAFGLGGSPMGPNSLGSSSVTQPTNRDAISTWITFSMLSSDYASLSSSLFLYATESGHAATCSTNPCMMGSRVMQDNINGNVEAANATFQGLRFVYTGATNAALGLTNGMTLLDVHFTDAELSGRRTTSVGSATVDGLTMPPIASVTYSSDLLNGLHGRPDISDAFDGNFGLGFSNVRNYLSFTSGAAVPSFAANISGSFAAELQASVPEPATWAFMIAGFGGAGGMLRRRRALAA